MVYANKQETGNRKGTAGVGVGGNAELSTHAKACKALTTISATPCYMQWQLRVRELPDTSSMYLQSSRQFYTVMFYCIFSQKKENM